MTTRDFYKEFKEWAAKSDKVFVALSTAENTNQIMTKLIKDFSYYVAKDTTKPQNVIYNEILDYIMDYEIGIEDIDYEAGYPTTVQTAIKEYILSALRYVLNNLVRKDKE